MTTLDEPFRLTRHLRGTNAFPGALYTCARPGYSMGRRAAKISDHVVDAWIWGLPVSREQIVILSLLGRKIDSLSEFSYYSFRGGFDSAEDRPDCPTWQEWLTARYGSKYRVCEFPTVDTEPISADTKKRIMKAILKFMQNGNLVILVDSGGIGRTGNVVSAMRKVCIEPQG